VEKKNIFRGYPQADVVDSQERMEEEARLFLSKCSATVAFLSIIAGYPKKAKLSANAGEKNYVCFQVVRGSFKDRVLTTVKVNPPLRSFVTCGM